MIIIFVAPYDPFDRSKYRYTFRNICLGQKENLLELKDSTTKVILNAKEPLSARSHSRKVLGAK